MGSKVVYQYCKKHGIRYDPNHGCPKCKKWRLK